VGDSTIATNYMDLAIPPEAQKVIITCAENHLYEPMKDFALNRSVRSDIWCREGVVRSEDPAQLFGGFAYGIIAGESLPLEFKAQGKTIDLSSPLYQKLTKLMAMMPISIGDFLSHPEGKDFAPLEIVGAVQILVACGIAQPMRGMYQATNVSTIMQPRFAGPFNRAQGHAEVSEEVCLASPALGGAVSVSAQEALVMQALDRAGLANSVSALLPELKRLAASENGMRMAAPTAETAHLMVEDIVSRSIVQWYAYGLLEAA
jgi:hypothetical protein